MRKKVLLSPASTVEDLRRIVEDAVNSISASVPGQDFSSDVDAGNFRLINVGNPAAQGDAVNVRFLKDALEKLKALVYRQLFRPNLNLAYGFNDAEFEVIPGGFTIKGVDMTKAFNFDTDIFGNTIDFTILDGAIDGPKLVAHSVTTLQLTTQEINIGGGLADKPIRLRIYDHDDNPIGWIGDDSIDHGGDTNFVGAWFKRALFGGDGTMPNMKAFIDVDGNMVLKSVFVYDADGTVGWIGNSGSYFGGWFRELYIGGAGPADAPLHSDSFGNVSLEDGSITINGSSVVISLNPTDPFKAVGTFGTLVVNSTGLHSNAPTFSGVNHSADLYPMQMYLGYSSSPLVYGVVQVVNGFGELYLSNATGNGGVYLRADNHSIELYPHGTYTPTTSWGSIRVHTDNELYYYKPGTGWEQLSGGGGGGSTLVDSTAVVEGSSDSTKKLRFEVDGFTSSATRVLTPQNTDYTIAGININQTFSADQTFSGDILASGGVNIGTSGSRFGTGYFSNLSASTLISGGAEIGMALIPSSDTTYSLGSLSKAWVYGYFAGGVYVEDTLVIGSGPSIFNIDSMTLAGQGSAPANPSTTDGVLYYYVSGATRQLRFKYHDGSTYQDKQVTLV